MNTFTSQSRSWQLLCLLPFVVYACAAFLTFIVVEEDAFIYFRIAQNMADGYGIVFNRGGEHIESGSSMIWQWLLAGIALLPVHLVIATKFLGVAFAGLSLWMMLCLSQRFVDDKRLVIFPALFLAASTPFYYWSHRGLETPFFIFSLLWLLDWLTAPPKISRWYVPAIVVFCGRPEGFLMLMAIIPWLWLERKRISGFWPGVFVFLLLCVLVEGWRLYYFHDLLPHAFYQKIGGDPEKGFTDLLQYSFWNGLWVPVLLALPVIFSRQAWKRDYIPLLLLIMITGCWGVIGADWKSFNRQLGSWIPFVFLFLVIMASGFSLRSQKNFRVSIAVFSLYALYLFVYSPYTNAKGETLRAPNYGCLALLRQDPAGYIRNIISATLHPDDYLTQPDPTLAGDHIGFNRNATVGRFIRENYPEGITVIFDQMGQAPYYAGPDKTFIDNTGLTDRMIGYDMFDKKAQSSTVFRVYENMLVMIAGSLWPAEKKFGYSKQEIVDRLFAANPALVLMRERYVERDDNTLIATFAQDKRFADNYRAAYRINRRDIIYERKDLPVKSQPVVPPGALVEVL